jgi:hypothetical protein
MAATIGVRGSAVSRNVSAQGKTSSILPQETPWLTLRPSCSFPRVCPPGKHPSRVSNHLGAAVAIVDVGANLDHARQARVVGRGQLLGAGAP